MRTYVATFFTHFGAVKFARDLHRQKLVATLMPVPRKLSSSCGTCVRFCGEGELSQWLPQEPELDRVFLQEEEGYTQIYENTPQT